MSAELRQSELSGIPSCPRCSSQEIWKSGRNGAGTQQWRCKTCDRVFVVEPYLKADIRLIADRMLKAQMPVPEIARILNGFVSRRWIYLRRGELNVSRQKATRMHQGI
jgi:transposase-like protein